MLEGSVRKVGNRVRITAQLINVDDGYHLWSETYDRQLEDVFAIQDEISRAIVDALKLRLGDDGGHAGGADQEHRGVHAVPEGPVRLQQGHRARDSGRRWTSSSSRCSRTRPTRGRTPASPTAGPSWPTTGWCRTTPTRGPRRRPSGRCSTTPTWPRRSPRWARCCAGTSGTSPARSGSSRRAVTLNDNHAEAHWAFGSVLPTVGRLAEAIEEHAEGAGARPALCGVQPLARPLPAVQRRLRRRDRPGPEDDGPERRLCLLRTSTSARRTWRSATPRRRCSGFSGARGSTRASAPTTR